MSEIETISTGASFVSQLGSNTATLVIVGIGYFIWKYCAKSHCHYTTGKGIDFGFQDEDDEEDEEDLNLREMYKLLMKQKSIKLKKKESFRIPPVKIPVVDSPRFLNEVKLNVASTL